MRHHYYRSSSLVALAAVISGAGIAACSSDNGASAELVQTSTDSLNGDACKAHKDLMKGALARHFAAGVDVTSDEFIDDDAEEGRRNFDDRRLHGLGANGRACADCHMASSHFQLSPAAVQARWQALQDCRAVNPDADDPLFRPIDADDLRTNGAAASSFKNLKNGLVRITFKLPSNVKLIDPATNAPSSETHVDVWRSVPSVLNVAVSGPDGQAPAWPAPTPPGFHPRAADGSQAGPNPRGGYQLDARVDTLQNQALGAFIAHAEVQTAPSQRVLDTLAIFQNGLSSPAPGALSELEQQGAAVFTRSCGQCHGGAAGSTPIPEVPERYHDIRSACPRPADNPTWCVASGGTAPCPPRFQFKQCASPNDVPGLAPRLYEITHPDGVKFRRPSTDPGRALLTGYVGQPGAPPPNGIPAARDDWQKLDNAPLRGIRHTAPYFHNNSAATLDDVLDHYEQFFKQVAVNTCGRPVGCAEIIVTSPSSTPNRPFTAAERPALRAFLDTL